MQPNTAIDQNTFAHRRNWGPVPFYPRVSAYKPPARHEDMIVVAGPCSVESAEQIHLIAAAAARAGATHLRGGLFRAGTYPSAKRGFGFVDEVLIAEFSRAAHENGLKTVVEVLDYSPESFALYDKYGDAYQVGARQMQNYSLLKRLSKKKRPVFLKRNMGATIDEFLGSAEWLLQENLCDVILVERGSQTGATHVRWDLSISMIPAVKALTQMPILVDASHGTGRRDLVEPMTLAGVAAGADGFLIEVHPIPAESLTDADQAYPLAGLYQLTSRAMMVRQAIQAKAEAH